MKLRNPDLRSPKELWDEQHDLQIKSPVVWIIKANELIEAFEALVREDERYRKKGNNWARLSWPAYMLAGYAIENLLKAILISQEFSFESDGRLRSHDLCDLAKLATIELSEQEIILLERLKEFVLWAGRYPIPLTSDPMRPRETPGGGFAPIPNHFPGEDWDAIRNFFSRLKGLLPSINYGNRQA